MILCRVRPLARDHGLFRWAPPILAIALLGPGGAVAGVLPDQAMAGAGQASGTRDASPAAAKPSLEDMLSSLRIKLEESRTRRDQANADSGEPSQSAGVEPEFQAEYLRQLDTLIYLYQVQTETIPELQRAEQALEGERKRVWSGFDEPPPYSILMLDDLMDAAEGAQGKVAAYESSLNQIQRNAQRFETDSQMDKAAARLAADGLDKAVTPADIARASVELELARIIDRVSDNRLSWANLESQLIKVQLATAQLETKLLERKIKLANQHVTFTEQDLAKVANKLEENRKELDKELQAAQFEHDRWAREFEQAQRALVREEAQQRQRPPGATTEPPEEPSARRRAADAWVQTLRYRIYALQTSATMILHMENLWKQRFLLVNSQNPDERREALALIRLTLERVHPMESYLYGELELIRADVIKQTARLDKLEGSEPEARVFEQSTLNAYLGKREDVERLQASVHRTLQALERWLRDYETGLGYRGLEEKLSELLAQAVDIGKTIWRFELFTVDDVLEIDGKPVAVTRGITFGKSIGALLMLVLGYWAATVFAGRAQQFIVRQYAIGLPQAQVFRRWIVATCLLILVVGVMNLMNIPLTVFAFLGGALAIGAGFGMQTLIKNLISGLLILLERKIKVGDIVEVDGIVGTVTEVDIRSSTVRGFDGVESMIPNSTFLEHRVTNWTYTNPHIRRAVKIGVAYGSPVRRVADILLDCAARHGVILQEPAPFVWFEDFGDNALLFGVYYWLEMRPQVNSYQIASDLRFMIEKRLSDEGIVIAFPQRDVHLSSEHPLRVELATAGPPEDGGRAPQRSDRN